MAESAPQIQYRDEFIAGFEQRQSLLRETTTTEAVIKGSTAVFLVADSGGATTVTRGLNGTIPGRADNNTQLSCTLSEEHDKVIKTGFNIFASQGNQRAIMQQTSMGVVNRKIDNQIITQLNTGTVNTGAAVPGNVTLYSRAQTMLQNASVPWDSWITLLCTPAFLGYLKLAPEFSSADWVNKKAFESDPHWRDKPMMYRWDNVAIISHPGLPGIGTASAKCFMYHKSSIGHAADTAGMQSVVDYDREDDYSYARTSIYMGGKLLQNAGVIVINHDDTGLSA